MIERRPAGERGQTQADWLDSRHTFSFNRYYDPRHMGYSDLRVINEDFVAPAMGFGAHSHRDMEIITYVLAGALEHKDSIGNHSAIRPGEVQRMSAGTGVTHSEFNSSTSEQTHLLQIWILPEREGLEPGYEQREFSPEGREGKWRLLASRAGREGSVTVHQDVELYDAALDAKSEIVYELVPGRFVWLQILKGAVTINSVVFKAGDGAAVSEEKQISIRADERAELLLFNLKS